MAIFKDLQDSGQGATIIGHFSLQLGNFQEVANIDNAREQSKNVPSETGSGKNPNRYTTEHDRDNVDVRDPVFASAELPADLLEVIDIWQKLPEPIRVSILSLIQSISI